MTKSVDEVIREAMEQGKFEHLANKGKKLDLNDYFDTPENLRVGYSVLKSANFVPEEVEILNEIEALTKKMNMADDETEQKKLRKEIEQRRLKYNILVEHFKRHSRI